jgi:DNA topoisomerase-3
MKLAEELYQAGFISYPRTETDIFTPEMDLQVSSFCDRTAADGTL